MVNYLLIENAEAVSVHHLFVAGCYLLPLLGGYISDRYWGKYKTIMILSVVYCIGHAVLAIWETKMGLYAGLALIALGAGGIKPCVSAHVGDQFQKHEEDKLRKIFDLFYWMINFGSFFASLITPWTLPKYGPAVAFGIPGILMAIATYVFWVGRKYYVHVPPTPKDPHGFAAVIASGLKNKKKAGSFFAGALQDHSQEQVDAVKAVFGIAKVFVTVSIFWALFDQHGSTWILQAKEMNLHFMGIDLLPSQIAALNPIMVMALIPLFQKIVYPGVESVFKTELTPLKKMGAGMFIAAFSFVLVAIFQYILDGGNQINVAWQFFPFLIITMAEVLISITGLEFAYTQAPRSMKSTIMSIWFLTVFFGNIITAYVAKINVFDGGNAFMFYAILMMVVAFIFSWIAKNYKMQNFMEG
jgi:POT family proton-dependent oligopeptide transporter